MQTSCILFITLILKELTATNIWQFKNIIEKFLIFINFVISLWRNTISHTRNIHVSI